MLKDLQTIGHHLPENHLQAGKISNTHQFAQARLSQQVQPDSRMQEAERKKSMRTPEINQAT